MRLRIEVSENILNISRFFFPKRSKICLSLESIHPAIYLEFKSEIFLARTGILQKGLLVILSGVSKRLQIIKKPPHN